MLLAFGQTRRAASSLPARTGTPALLADLRAAVLSPSCSSSSTRGPTNVMPASSQARAQLGVLGQKPVARMDGVDAVLAWQIAMIAVDVQVRPDRLARLADQVGLVGLEAVQGVAVFVRVDRDGADAQLVGRAEHADGDFAAVGDEQLFDGLHSAIRSRTNSVGNARSLPAVAGGVLAAPEDTAMIRSTRDLRNGLLRDCAPLWRSGSSL